MITALYLGTRVSMLQVIAGLITWLLSRDLVLVLLVVATATEVAMALVERITDLVIDLPPATHLILAGFGMFLVVLQLFTQSGPLTAWNAGALAAIVAIIAAMDIRIAALNDGAREHGFVLFLCGLTGFVGPILALALHRPDARRLSR